MMLDLNPIYEQLKRIADYLEILARKEMAPLATVTAATGATGAATASAKQVNLFDTPAGTEVPAGTAAVEKKGKGRPKKDSVAQAAAEDLNAELQATAAAVVPKATEQDVREGLMRFVQRNSKDEAIALLKKFGALKIKDLKPADFDAIVAEMNADEELFHGKATKK